jgi:GMP synthase-like glutamine amidotransferase
MRVHILQHVEFEGPGAAKAWLTAQGARVDYTRFFAPQAKLPDPRTLDLIIAMGGPMSVNDEDKYPWLQEEKRFLSEAIRHGTPVLGICLGAQLIAAACGSKVTAARSREIGWHPISAVDGDDSGCFSFPPQTTAFHWHGETFDLPAGAVHLARSAACENQAFQLGRSVVGLQFHLEAIPDSVELLIRNCGQELADGGPWVQSETAIRSVPPSNYQTINALLGDLLYYLLART